MKNHENSNNVPENPKTLIEKMIMIWHILRHFGILQEPVWHILRRDLATLAPFTLSEDSLRIRGFKSLVFGAEDEEKTRRFTHIAICIESEDYPFNFCSRNWAAANDTKAILIRRRRVVRTEAQNICLHI